MKIINISIQKQKMVVDAPFKVVAGTIGLYGVQVEYDEEWDEIPYKLLMLKGTKTIKLEEKGEIVKVPGEVISEPCCLEFGLIGFDGNGDVRITTYSHYGSSMIWVKSSDWSGDVESDEVDPPTPTIWEDIKKEIGEIKDKVENIEDEVENLVPGQPGYGESITVDDELNVWSENPVQNKVITQKFGELSNEIGDQGDEIKELNRVVGKRYPVNYAMEQGGLDGGNPSKTTIRLRSVDFTRINPELTYTLDFELNDGSKIIALYYYAEADGATYMPPSWYVDSVPHVLQIPDGANYVKFLVRNASNTEVVPSDIVKFELKCEAIDIEKEVSFCLDYMKDISYKDIVFDFGGLTVPDGKPDQTNSLRIHSVDVLSYPLDVSLTPMANYSMVIHYYDNNVWMSSTSWLSETVVIPKNTQFKIAFRKNDNSVIDVSYAKYLNVKCNNIGAVLRKYDFAKNENSANSNLMTRVQRQGTYTDGSYGSGMCIADNMLFHFGISDDNHVNYANAFVYECDTLNNYQLSKTVTHNFGHINTVSYNKNNDCLAFGNGSGNYQLACKFYVYPDFVQKYKSGETVFNIEDAIEYDCSAMLSGETQCNCIWGDDNLQKNDLIFMITNDNAKIRIIQLGKGTNQLPNGNYTSADSKRFNGSFKIQKLYTQNVGELETESVDFCVQDACYRNGLIYAGIGHNRFEYWKMKLDDSNDSIITEKVTKKLYGDNGNELVTGISAIEAITDYLIIHCTDDYFYFYKI